MGPDELHLVRVVEMTDRKIGTKVHTNITASDSAALLPLQEALGYDLAQSLFSQERNLVLEGLTDYWYLDAVSQLLEADNIISLNPKIALRISTASINMPSITSLMKNEKRAAIKRIPTRIFLNCDIKRDKKVKDFAIVISFLPKVFNFSSSAAIFC